MEPKHFFLLFFTLFTLTSCEQTDLTPINNTPNRNKVSLKGNVKRVVSVESEAKMMFNELTETNKIEIDTTCVDKDGYIVYESEYKCDKNVLKGVSYEYDKIHNILKETSIQSSSEIGYAVSTIEYSYDTYGNETMCITSVKYHVIGREDLRDTCDTVKYEYDYDKDGKLLRKKENNYRYEHIYNQKGNVVKDLVFIDDTISSETIYEYQNDTLLISETEKTDNKEISRKYEYHDNGQRKRMVTKGGYLPCVTEYGYDGKPIHIKYDDGTEVIHERLKTINKYPQNLGKPYEWIEQVFVSTEDGEMLSEIWTYGDYHKFSIDWEYKYDDHGNWIKKLETTKVGSSVKYKLTDREIEYY